MLLQKIIREGDYMSALSRGLARKDIVTHTSSRECYSCKGRGSKFEGMIDVPKIGITPLIVDCNSCDGEGKVNYKFRKAIRKSSVEVF